jgi:hypothetical protein
MTNYVSTITKDSAALPGVRFTIREISEGQRRRLRRELAPAFARVADIETEREEFYAELAERFGKPVTEIALADLTPRERNKFASLNERIDFENDTAVNPGYFKAAFLGVKGLSIEGKSADDMDADALIECGPPALVREITRAILRGAELEDAEKANLSSPSTSTAPVEGPTSDTSAANVSGAAGSATVTADASPAA